MVDITRTGADEHTSRRSILVWLKVIGLSVTASAAQIFMYGGPRLWGGSEPVFNTIDQIYVPLVLFFFFGPGLVAAFVSALLLRSYYRRQGSTLPRRVVVVLVGSTLLSCYVGVFVSFNVWGT